MNNSDDKRKQQPYKIALIGAQCVGKTTILNALKLIFSDNINVTFMDEGARIFFDTYPNITDRGMEVQKRIQDFVLQREQQIDENVRCIVTDRSVIDPIVMTQVWDNEQNAQQLYKNVESWIKTYSFFFILTPHGVTSLQDQHRRESQKQRLITHDLFVSICQKNNLPYEVVTGTLEERIARIKKEIRKIL